MKKLVLFLTLTVFVAGIVLTGCNPSGEKVDSAKAKLEAVEYELKQAKENFNDEYEKFKTEANKKTEENESFISVLKEESKKLKNETKKEYEKTIADLERRNEEMKAKIRDYKNNRDEKWEAFKSEIRHDANEIGQSLKNLVTNNVK